MTSTFPLAKLEDMKGKKIGGAGSNLSWLKGTGAVGVQSSLNVAYNDMKTGVYDGNIIFITGGTPAKLFEVAPQFNELNMGAMFGGALSINRNRWNGLPEEVKQAFHKGAALYKEAMLVEQSARIAAAMETWKAHGKVVEFPQAEIDRFVKAIPNPTHEWIKQAGEPAKKVLSAYMDAVRATGFKFPRDFDKE
jgi:TRAP-type C4-dicarboxylate transport system substrate-binding protein